MRRVPHTPFLRVGGVLAQSNRRTTSHRLRRNFWLHAFSAVERCPRYPRLFQLNHRSLQSPSHPPPRRLHRLAPPPRLNASSETGVLWCRFELKTEIPIEGRRCSKEHPMKAILMGLLALSFLAGTAAAPRGPRRERLQSYLRQALADQQRL